MFPSECVLERRVRSDDDQDFASTSLPLFILKCDDRKVHGYTGDKLEIYNQRLKGMVIGVRLADTPPAVSYLAILRGGSFANIVAVDKTVIVISLWFHGEERLMSYLIYDAAALSLRLIPAPWSSSVCIARPCHGDDDYALVDTMNPLMAGKENNGFLRQSDSLFLWRPSSPSRPWSEKKKPSFPDLHETDARFSFNGHVYWVDLLCGVSYCSCDALFDDDNSRVVKFGFIPLPVDPGAHHRYADRMAEPAAYRAMGVVRGSFIRFVSIDGFEDYVKLKKRTVTVWKLLGHDEGWEKEHEFSLKTLWGFQGFDNMSKDLSPMHPLLSTKDTDVVYLVLGEYQEDRFNFEFLPSVARYRFAVDMRNNIVRTSVRPEEECNELLSCIFSQYLRKALVGPCDDGGIPMEKKRKMKEPRRDGGNLTEAPIIPMKKKPRRRRKHRCC
ncbi:hypothetical protein ACQ4PT_034625 [Festuca glaucescens]